MTPSIQTMTQSALFAGILCIFSPIVIPIGIIPLTLGNFAVMLTGVILNCRNSLYAVGTYLLLGFCGLPLFSGGRSGVAVLLGPTGGYVWSYLFIAAIIAYFSKLYAGSKKQYIVTFMASILGVVISYVMGTFQYILVTGSTWQAAVAVAILPFVAFDIIKAIMATAIGLSVRRRLLAMNLI